jgi:hypothetical protein
MCNGRHTIPEEGFRVDHNTRNAMEAHQHLKESPKMHILKSKLEEFEKLYTDLELVQTNPSDYVFEYVSELRRRLDLQKEELKQQIDQIHEELIKRVDDFEQSCKSEFKYLEKFDLECYKKMVQSINDKLRDPTVVNSSNLKVLDQMIEQLELLNTDCSKKLNSFKLSVRGKRKFTFFPNQKRLDLNDFGEVRFERKCELNQILEISDNSVLQIDSFISFNEKELIAIKKDGSIKCLDLNTGQFLNDIPGIIE